MLRWITAVLFLSRIGFPEVLIGLLPGAEGTVRLPRVAGLAFAMDVITSGKQVPAFDAYKHGVVDKVCGENVLEEAKVFANKVIGQPLGSRRLSGVDVKDAGSVDSLFEAALSLAKKKFRGQIAPIYCLKSVRNSAKMPFHKAAAEESKLIIELMTGSQSAALRYSFFAERSVPKWKLPCGATVNNTKPDIIRKTGVVGAGTMGSGIAVCLIQAGIPVILVEKDQKGNLSSLLSITVSQQISTTNAPADQYIWSLQLGTHFTGSSFCSCGFIFQRPPTSVKSWQMLEKAIKNISGILDGTVRVNRMTSKQKDQCMGILKGASTINELSDADLVIEAVYENLELKRQVFSQLDQVCKASTVLCSNTSTLDIDKIASATKRPEKVVGTHFFSPAYIMRLLENVYGTKTSPTTVATVMELGRRIGKVTVLVKSCHGFVANRTHLCFGAELKCCVLFLCSYVKGIDVGWRIRQEVAKSAGLTLTPETRYLNGERVSTLGDSLYEKGRYGIKTGKGWYKYDPSNPRKPVPDSDVEDIITRHCARMGLQRQNIPPKEVIDRCLYAAINESFRVLEERVAEKPQDIDVIWQYGFSFPRYAGGPLYFASQVGLKKVFEKVCYFHEKFPYSSHWVPSDLLRKLASHSVEIPMDQWTEFLSCSKL
ncbi:3-hydroxyacyl-CoA dehydrogenase [Elysia marginata]|uniref:3-hydroxyacyl-CoA dehydrogenase n=1 Tax=Elysia marginata TaxID=1093978 RepID=A0AAV4HZM2_9GAST|nr:3-hydroxyacyl-CoA dehydrogenase [Elysia marginata]